MYIGVCRGLDNDNKSMQNVQNADMQLSEADKFISNTQFTSDSRSP